MNARLYIHGAFLAAGCLFATPVRAATPGNYATMNSTVGDLDYNSKTKRLAWGSGLGICGGSFPNPAVVSLAPPDDPFARRDDTGMGCGGLVEGVTTDEAYVYFTQGGWLWRLALGAPKTQTPTRLVLGVSAGFTPTAIARLGDDLLWVESNGTFTKLWKADKAGTGLQQLVSTGNYGPVRKLRTFYDVSGFNFPPSCLLLSENGQLWKGRVDQSGPLTLLASGIGDFDYRLEGGGGQVLSSTRVFAIESGLGGRLLSVRYNNGASTVLYTTASDRSLATVAVDEQKVYLIENFTYYCQTDPPLICPGYDLWRQDRPVDGSAPGSWVYFGTKSDSSVRSPHHLYSSGKVLFWADGQNIRAISADAPPIYLNFVAMGLEIVQTIQNLNNEVPLVQGKPTYVRAYARTDFNMTGNAKFYPNGSLKVWGRPLLLQPFQLLGTLSPEQAGLVDSTFDFQTLRNNFSHSFLFRLPEAWTRFQQVQCEFTVNPDHVFNENVGFPYADNTATGTAVFYQTVPQCWVLVAVATVPFTYYPQSERFLPGFWRILDRALGLLPAEKYQAYTWPDVIGPIGSTGYSPFAINNDGDWVHINTALAFWSIGRTKPCGCERYIGTVHPTAGLGSGVSGKGVTCAAMRWFANISSVRMDPFCANSHDCPNGGVTLAHELAHNFCRLHAGCGATSDVDMNYPYPNCTLTIPNLNSPAAHFGFDAATVYRIDPSVTADLTSYGPNRWISDYTWKGILFSDSGLQAFLNPCFLRASSPGGGAPAPGSSAVSDVLVLTGTIDTGTDQVALLPGFVVPPDLLNAPLADPAAGADSDYHVRFTDAGGNRLTEVPLVIPDFENHQPTPATLVGFGQTFLLPPATQIIQILRANRVLVERYFSAHAPVLSLSTPAVDAVSQTLQFDWSASDEDGDLITFIVQYSADAGQTWIPLQVGSPNRSLHVDARELPGGSQAFLRVIASDGLNCTVATSGPFVVPQSPPAAVIVGLQEGDRVGFGSSRPVRGIGHDTLDGVIDSEQLTWQLLGPAPAVFRGKEISTRDLTPGPYQAILTVRNSSGLSSSNSVRFEVLPPAVPDGPSPNLDGLPADEAYANAPVIRLFTGSAQPGLARFSHGDGFLHVAFTGLPFFSNSPLSIGIVVNTGGTVHATPQTNDVGFFVDETGLPFQWHGDGADMVLNLEPDLGVQSAVSRGDSAWSAELKIPDHLLGGWGHAVGLLIQLRDENGATSQTWPAAAGTADPASWALAMFDTTLAASNRPPIAVVSLPRVRTLSAPEWIVLNGEPSFDPETQPLTYHWTQLAGPSVTLSNATSASPSFLWAPTNTPVEFRFRLVVNDGDLDSSPADASWTIYSVALNPQPLPPVQRDAASGTVNGAVGWQGAVGDRSVIEASQDLIQWVPIRTNSVDFDGRVHFRDPDASRYPHRFYRARGIAATERYGIGIHFGADDPPPAGSALASADVAGVVPQAHWNNLNGPRGSASGIVADLNGAAVSTTVLVEWGSPNTWSSTGRGEENNGFPPGGDRLLMSGYLDTDNGPGVATAAVFGIDPVIASGGYDVIVYILGGVSGRGGAYTIGGVTKYGTAAANPAAHIEDPGVGLADTGTYLRFTGLTGSSFMLIADANSANGPNRNFRAPINGIQIVPTTR
jgi:hypothetical protein